ncbi:phage tail protein [Limosilactobacillus reuteri]|uniref:Phage tape measure protein n=1 Tax=Limosilactobacillus reuteri subsp. rodentium (strain DSM 17509 / CIP 109821 / 100-23) TaxID=349123 RepID=B3XND2_LIMR1|nr:tape measure protein [Limosilactobacillus reuteri]EDX42684.1 phage tape measure protein [Limosilactobacillus reuteri subsp. rodentium]MCC4474902.1 tape measure protein [Limosilactobacillus reuteri]
MSQSMSVEAVLSAYDESFSATLDKALKSINNLGRETQSTSQTVSAGGSSISSTFKSMAGAMGVVAIAGKAWDVVKDSMSGAINRFDTLNKYPVVMKALDYSTKDVAKSTAILSKGVDGLPTSLQDVTSVAQQLAPLTGSATKASKSAIALNNAFLASGASVADTSRGLQQYTQMLSTGKVDLMSYRTLMETMPIALRKVANSFGFTGKSAEQDLYKALQSGQITVDQLNDRFIKLNGGVNGFAQLAKKNSEGIGTSFANLKNAVVKNLANMLSAIDNGFKQAGFGSIAQVLDNMKGSINSAFQVIGPVVTNATVVILNFVKVVGGALKSAFSNDIFRTAVVGILGFVGAVMAAHKVISIFTTLRTAIVGLSVIAKAGNLAMAFSEAMSTLAKTSKIAGGAMKAFSAVASLGPWGIIAVAIVAVVAALTYFFTQTKTGRALWQSFTTWLSGAWQSLVGVATTVWNAIGNAINEVVNFIKPYWQGLVTFFTGIWTSIVAGVTPIWQGLVNVFNSIINAIVAVWQALAPIIVPIVAGVVAIIGATLITIVTVFQTVWNMLVPIVQVVWQLISTVVSTAITMLGTVIQTGLAIIVAIWNVVWNTFSIVVSTVWNVITTIISTVLNVIAGIIQAITAAIQGDWSGAWNAIQNVVSTVLNAISSIVSSVLSGVAGIFSGVMNGLKSVVSAVWNGIKSLFSEGVNFIKSVVHIDLGAAGRAIMNSLWNGMKSIWNGIKNWVSGIADWIKEHKGPISYDRKLLIPAGQAIMNGLNNGLINGFGDVQSNVSDMANQIQQAITTPGFDIGASIGNLSSINSNYTGSLAIQDSQLQMQNNALLRQLLNKDTTMVLDDGTLVGYTADQYDYRLGQNTALKDRWSR